MEMNEEAHLNNPSNLNPVGSWPRTVGAAISSQNMMWLKTDKILKIIEVQVHIVRHFGLVDQHYQHQVDCIH